MIRYAAAILVAAAAMTGAPALVPALAEGEAASSPPECPPGAAQSLYTVLAAVENGEAVDGNQVYEFAEAGFRLCPEDPGVQGLTALLFTRLGEVASTPDDKLLVFGRAFEAALRVDRFYGSGQATEVTNPDGSVARHHLYGPVFSAVETVVMPSLLGLAQDTFARRLHPIFEETPLTACPYTQNRSSGVEYEVSAIVDGWMEGDSESFRLIYGRLERLRAACPHREGYLVWALAAYNNRAVYANEFRPDTARSHARAALAYAAELASLDPKTLGDLRDDRDTRTFYIDQMRVNLRDKFPDL